MFYGFHRLLLVSVLKLSQCTLRFLAGLQKHDASFPCSVQDWSNAMFFANGGFTANQTLSRASNQVFAFGMLGSVNLRESHLASARTTFSVELSLTASSSCVKASFLSWSKDAKEKRLVLPKFHLQSLL